ncbi:pyridoxal phosphate-dependent aminotransferase [Kaustia mangrovi]|uniref:aspartate transaminase n=1 Tax=Kaustia mangrovi TaxID=2593653 RepID=A0A7S8C5D9_9HYPH|nr:pyridoxal phosphate-dependent aminotransferase [Kaustia mangrovi]QPC43519.1 pyridoxal phosphate-dependent aminotransferase [Kaustia mangrovi]
MKRPTPEDLLNDLRPEARNEPESSIMTVINHGFGRQGLIPLWAGEGNLPTPRFICDAAVKGLEDGETFYTWQRGIPELRDALARYHARLYGTPFEAENFFVTGGGMQSIQTAIQAIAGEGDEVVLPTPAWPNYAGPLRMKGSRPVEVPMTFAPSGWQLDLDRLFDAVTERTKAIVVNTPSNPLGWVAPAEDLLAIRDFARERGLWIVSDEVYARYYFPQDEAAGPLPPSFLDICDTEERLIMTNTFSKNWAMTGWRMGWMVAPQALGDVLENLIQYNTSGTAAFMQRAGVVALDEGEDFLAEQVRQAREGRDIAYAALSSVDGARFAVPEGAFYLFFTLDGMTDSTETALRIIDEAGVGLAPGAAFGPGGEAFLRLCFLRERGQLVEAMDRLTRWLARNR